MNSDVTTTDVGKKKPNYKMIIIIGAIFIVVLAVYKRIVNSGWQDAPDAAITPYDEATIDGVLNSEDQLAYALPADDSPAFFNVNSATMTDEQIAEFVGKVGDRHSEKIAAIAASIQSDAASVMDLSAVLLLQNGGTGVITTAGIDLWFSALEKWTPMFVGMSEAVASGIADVAAAQIEGINNATECVGTTFVKKVTETSDTSDTTYYKVEVGNRSSRGFLGMNKKKSSSETRTSIRTLVRNDTRTIEYIPHCTNWQLDPSRFAGIMEAGSLALESLYGMLKTVLAMAPRAEQFIKVSTT